MRIILPPATGRRAADVASGREPAAVLAPASTVVLVRAGPDGGIEAYLQRRHVSLAFAGGKYAFPGGRVDPRDAELPGRLWHGPDAGEWARRFDVEDAHQARAHVVGVVRELFEETGVLLAVDDPHSSGRREPTEDDRAAVADGMALADLLDDLGRRLDASSLRAWSRWLTPRFERRRFDAWFFVAALPDGQDPRVATEESHEGRWVAPEQARDRLRTGDLAMLPPTWWTLGELAAFCDVASVMRAPRGAVRYTVGWTAEGDDAVMVLPDDPRYPGDDPREGS
jgi:8-oxo-dGTP pyrophosphatase MutT (NUDIX family)